MESNIYNDIFLYRQQFLELGISDEKKIISCVKNKLKQDFNLTDDNQLDADIKLVYEIYDIPYPEYEAEDDEDDDLMNSMEEQNIFNNIDQEEDTEQEYNIDQEYNHNQLDNILNNILARINPPNMDENGEIHFEIHVNPMQQNFNFNHGVFTQLFMNLMNGANQMEDVSVTLSEESLKKLPIFEYKDVPKEDKEKCTSCTICLENYKENDKIRVLPCKHGFHPDCIDPWLQQYNYKCPLCRNETAGEKVVINNA